MSFPNIAGYRIIKTLSESKRAQIFLAEQSSLQRVIALKVLNQDVSNDDGTRKRVMDEGKAAARLTHPNLLGVFDIGEYDGRHYIATEYVSGGTLRDKLEQGALRPDLALAVTRDLANGLAFLHTQGFVHRDIKPSNILFREDGMAVLGEAGVTRVSGLSSDDVAFGSPHYMSPERAQAQPVDRRSDLYSLGVVLWEMLTGKLPFEGDDPFEVAIKHINEPIPLLPTSLASLQKLFARLLAKNPEQRPGSAADLVQVIDQALAGRGSAVQNKVVPPPVKPQTQVPAPPNPANPDFEAQTTQLKQLDLSEHPLVGTPTALVPTVPEPKSAKTPTPAPAAPEATMVLPMTPPKAASSTVVMGPVPQNFDAASGATRMQPSAPIVGLEATAVSPRFQSSPNAPPMADNFAANSTRPIEPVVPAPYPVEPAFPNSSLPREVRQSEPVSIPVRRASGGGWLIWIGAIGLLSALAGAVWYYQQSREEPMTLPTAGGTQVASESPSTGEPVQTGAELASILEKAANRQGMGDFVNPTDDCAAKFYRDALEMDPNSQVAKDGLADVAASVKAQIDGLLQEGNISKARATLDLALQFFPEHEGLLQSKAQLAEFEQ